MRQPFCTIISRIKALRPSTWKIRHSASVSALVPVSHPLYVSLNFCIAQISSPSAPRRRRQHRCGRPQLTSPPQGPSRNRQDQDCPPSSSTYFVGPCHQARAVHIHFDQSTTCNANRIRSNDQIGDYGERGVEQEAHQMPTTVGCFETKHKCALMNQHTLPLYTYHMRRSRAISVQTLSHLNGVII